MGLVCCVDFGSTYTKALLVDDYSGALLGSASHRTTVEGDVMDGYDACRAALAEQHAAADRASVLACSSAGGGLRIAVVGTEELVTAEAGRRVALSSGGRVVRVLAGGLDDAATRALQEAEPDVVLLVGGTDGGNSEVLEHDAAVLADLAWAGPVVVAGDVEAQPRVVDRLTAAGTPCVRADNVVPRIGVLRPDSARAAIREMFLAHVIGGKHLSTRPAFAAMVRGATPDVVLRGVEVLADLAGDVVVVDVGGATTDVHSVVALDPELGEESLAREVVAATPLTRTVEGDLGMRWSAPSTVAAAKQAGLGAAYADLGDAAAHRRADPGMLPATEGERAEDLLVATAAVLLAVRRHAGRSRVVVGPDGRVLERSGTDLRQVRLLVGSGGVLRSAEEATAQQVLGGVVGRSPDGWQQPEAPKVVVDRHGVLAAVGLLAGTQPGTARELARTVVDTL